MQKLSKATRRILSPLRLPKPRADQRWVVFEDGRVAFLVPSDYTMHHEPDETVAVYPPGKDSGITLRFSLHPELLYRHLPADIAEQLLDGYARERGLTLIRLRDKVFLTESSEADWQDRRILMHSWQVGAGRIFVVCSATVWGADRNSDTIQQALAFVPQVLESLRFT
jgi:hypothetical protein